MKLQSIFVVLLLVCNTVCTTEVTAQDSSVLRVFTHGEGDYARLQADGTLVGTGVDLLSCAMARIGRAYTLEAAPMIRTDRMVAKGLIDIWFPTYRTGDPMREKRLAGKMDEMTIFWFVRASETVDPTGQDFRANKKATAFPGALPDRYLHANKYTVIEGTDDQNRLLLMLLDGRVDAILSASFETSLTPRMKAQMSKVRKVPHVTYDMAFEIKSRTLMTDQSFIQSFRSALNTCSASQIAP